MIFLRLICILSAILLTACHEDKTSTNYLLAHPYYLKAELEKCHLQQSDDRYCQQLQATAHLIVNLIEEVQSDPEGLGDHVLRLQMKKDQLQSQLEKASAQDPARAKLDAQLQALQEDIKQHMAILSLNTPD